MFVGLNPSTANELQDDPTITRVKRFAAQWGYGGVYMMNLFAYVTPYPEELKKVIDPVGSNDIWLRKISAKCDKIVFAWGAFKGAKDRAEEVIKKFPGSYALVINNDGSPKHPLYVRKDQRPIEYWTIGVKK